MSKMSVTTTTASPQLSDAVEESLGISVYLTGGGAGVSSSLSTSAATNDVAGFSAVLKGRYSDFVVHEVGLDGSLARLTCMEPKILNQDEEKVINKPEDQTENEQPPEKKVKVKEDDKSNPNEQGKGSTAAAVTTADGSVAKKVQMEEDDNNNGETKNTKDSEDWASIQSELSELIGLEAAKETLEFLKNKDTADKLPLIELPPCNEKDKRRKLHEWIRSRLDHIAKADTIERETDKIVRLWLNKRQKEMPNYDKFNRGGRGGGGGKRGRENNNSNNKQHQNLPTDKPYLQFVLYKENMDTASAMNQLVSAHDRATGGGRDRGGRGRGGRGRGGRGGGPPKLRLGYAGMKDKRGVTSQFITVNARQVQPHQVMKYCDRWSSNDSSKEGGGHTQGSGVAVMRVGNFRYVKNELSLGRLKGNRFDIALRNISLGDNDDGGSSNSNVDVQLVLETAANALKENGFINYYGVQRFGKFHDTHRTGMAVLKGDFRKAVDIIMEPKAGERESTAAARKEWQNRFDKCNTSDNNARKKAERECASRVVKNLGRFMNSEVALLSHLERSPLEYQRAYSRISKTMRMMFVHAVQSYLWNHVASYRLSIMPKQVVVGDLVYLRDPGDDADEETSGQNAATKEVKTVTEEDVASSKYTLKDIVLPMIGTKTKVPENDSGKHYRDLLSEQGLNLDMFAKVIDRDTDFPGDYRKMICHPTDVDYEIIEYNDPRQPLIPTDLMILKNIPIQTVNKDATAAEKTKEIKTETGANENNDQDKNGAENSNTKNAVATKSKVLVGMNVGFTLPSSAYATVAIRELMKRPTSGDYQSNLSLD